MRNFHSPAFRLGEGEGLGYTLLLKRNTDVMLFQKANVEMFGKN